jgi:hypothetical protein
VRIAHHLGHEAAAAVAAVEMIHRSRGVTGHDAQDIVCLEAPPRRAWREPIAVHLRTEA